MIAAESAPACQSTWTFSSVILPMATVRCSAKLDGLLELTGYKLMQGAGDQRLIGNPFHDGPFLQLLQVVGGNTNVDALVLLESPFGGCFQAALLCSEMLNALELPTFKITQDLQFLFVQFQWVAAHFRYSSFEHTARRDLRQFKQNPSMASFQHGMLESRLTWMFSRRHPCEPGCRQSVPA